MRTAHRPRSPVWGLVFQSIAGSAAAMAIAASSSAADIRVFSGGAPQEALRALAPEFEKETGHRLSFTFALVTEIQQRLAAGERADVVLLPVPLLAATGKILPLRPESRVVLARVGIGVIVANGAAKPDISTAEGVRELLLGARAIALPDASVPSGSHLMRIFEDAGIADRLRPKLLFKAAIHGGAEVVAKGEADVGLYLVSEVLAANGVKLAGLLPPPFQSFVVYAAAVPLDNTAPAAALAFLKFVSARSREARWKAAGFELVGPN